jgi:hypothetical protein
MAGRDHGDWDLWTRGYIIDQGQASDQTPCLSAIGSSIELGFGAVAAHLDQRQDPVQGSLKGREHVQPSLRSGTD